VCWLLGFTQGDPLQWRLTFDRFLTPDRIRPPDIDLDIEDIRRTDVVEYLAGKYDLTQIGTYGRIGLDEETGRGSVFVKWMSGQRKRLGDDFARRLGHVTNVNDLSIVAPDTAEQLRQLGRRPLRSSPGAHAAGFVLSQEGLRVEDWIPTMLIASSNTMVTQLMMDDVEDAGFVKIDLLGLRSLSTVAKVLEYLGKPPGDLSWIPLKDSKTFTMLRKGKPGTGVFQLEGYTAAKGCKEIKPRTIDDLILINALYRPATIDHGYTATFVERRAGGGTYVPPHPIFGRHLKETHGVPVFQEQVLAILRDLGMPVEKLNDFLTAVKGKHAKGGYSDKSDALVAGAKADFDRLCHSHGMSVEEVDEAWSLVEGFAAYGFNRAHATAYSLLGYQMAYLKVHFPLEFHCAVLATTTGDKQAAYVKEARRCGIRILRADVNLSGSSWTIDTDQLAIRRGLSSIKGVGEKAALAIEENAPYDDLQDLIDRTPSRVVTGGKGWGKGELNGVLAKLRQNNALRSLDVLPLG
jgi:DNA polymerase-3 subunit alpha